MSRCIKPPLLVDGHENPGEDLPVYRVRKKVLRRKVGDGNENWRSTLGRLQGKNGNENGKNGR